MSIKILGFLGLVIFIFIVDELISVHQMKIRLQYFIQCLQEINSTIWRNVTKPCVLFCEKDCAVVV